METNKKYPLFPWLAIFFILGVYWQSVSDIRSIYLFTASFFVIASAFFMKKIRYRRFILIFGFFLIGMGWATRNCELADLQNRLFEPYIESKSAVTLTGTVINFPSTKRGKTKFYLKVDKTDLSLSPRLLIYLKDKPASPISFADKIKIHAKIRRTSCFRLNRFLTYREYLSFRNIYFIARTDKIEVLSSPLRWLTRLRKKLLDNLAIGIGGTKESQLICAMLLGERPDIDYHIFRQFAVFGIIHILVISGLHIGCVVFIGITLLRLTGIGKKGSLLIMFPLMIFYLFLVGFKVSITRAIVMISFYFCADLFNRDRNAVHALIFAGMLQLMFMPALIYDHGFQYSFMSVAAILFIYPILIVPFKGWSLFKLIQYPILSFSVWIVISPLAAYRNGVFSPIGFILGTFALMFVQVIVLVGTVSACTGFLLKIVSELFNLFNFVMIKILLAATSILYDTAGLQSYFRAIPSILFVFYYIGLTMIIVFFRKTDLRIIGMIILFLSIIFAGIF